MESSAKKRRVNRTEKSKKYFKNISDENGKVFYECALCNRKVNGTKISNLTAHLRMHPDKYADVCSNDSPIECKRLKLLLDCVELVGVNGRPFKCLTDSAIQSMNKDLLADLQRAGCALNLNDPHLHEVKNQLKDISLEIRDKISNEVKNRPISLLVDIVTKRSRSIFGVSIQYIVNENVKIRSIGMIELEDKHTGIYLANLIIDRLKLLGIDLKQVITITTDNGANVLKMVRDLEMHLQSAIDEAGQPTPPSQTPQNTHNETRIVPNVASEEAANHEIGVILSREEELTDDQAMDQILKEIEIDDSEPSESQLETNQNLLNAMQSNMKNDYGLNVIWDVTGINCIVHTLQLAIGDSIKALNEQIRNLIELCRRVAKMLRMASTQRDLKMVGIDYNRPVIDVVTRWGSLYQMVNYFDSFQLFFNSLHM